MQQVTIDQPRRSSSSRPGQRDLQVRRTLAAAELMTAVPLLAMKTNPTADEAVITIEQEIQALLDALPSSQPVLEATTAETLFAANLLDEDGFTLTPDQFKAGLRLSIAGDGRISCCPSCTRRRLLTFADTEPSGKRFSEKIRTVCADALGDHPTCGYYELALSSTSTSNKGRGKK